MARLALNKSTLTKLASQLRSYRQFLPSLDLKRRQLMQERASLTQGYDEGPEGRFGGQQKAVRLILDNPFGIGTHTFREKHHHEEVHNVYLTMFHYAGWIGGLPIQLRPDVICNAIHKN